MEMCFDEKNCFAVDDVAKFNYSLHNRFSLIIFFNNKNCERELPLSIRKNAIARYFRNSVYFVLAFLVMFSLANMASAGGSWTFQIPPMKQD